jgi:hypothetical protein
MAARDEPGDDVTPLDPSIEPSADLVKRAQKKAGFAGAVVMGAMVAMRDILEEERKTDPVTVESSSDPHDIDTDGVHVDVETDDGDMTVGTDPLPPMPERRPSMQARRRPRTHKRT